MNYFRKARPKNGPNNDPVKLDLKEKCKLLRVAKRQYPYMSSAEYIKKYGVDKPITKITNNEGMGRMYFREYEMLCNPNRLRNWPGFPDLGNKSYSNMKEVHARTTRWFGHGKIRNT